MEYNHVSASIFNETEDNLRRLAELFPAAVKDKQLDVAALREYLGEFEDVTAERYELTWAGKQAAKKAAQTDVAGRTLRFIAADSKNADTTENLYIEGDNLEVLKLLRQNYYGAVKMIYIDPPYNTGNDFVYRDDFTMAKADSDEAEGETDGGERMVVNQKSGNRYHANWLNMIYPRLRVAKDLLRDDGVIFISIDDNEVKDLRAACDEVFGESNFVAQVNWKGRGGRQDSKYYAVIHEYILVYAKMINEFAAGEDVKSGEVYPKFDEEKGRYYKTQLLRKWGSNSRRADRPNLYYPIIAPDGSEVYPMLGSAQNLENFGR